MGRITPSDITVVECPCCNDVLYRCKHLADGTWTTSEDSPRFDQDARGPFVVCAHCSKRIDFLVLGSDKDGRHVFHMAKQTCK